MPVIEVPQYSFSSGVLDDRLRSRVDLERVASGCSELENNYISLEGTAVRRPGTKYLGLSASNARLRPFQRDNINNYVLEFTENKIRIIKDDYFLSDSNGIIELSTPYTAEEISNIKYCQNVDRMFFFISTRPVMYLKRNSSTDWEFAVQDFESSYADPLFVGDGDYPSCGMFFQQRFWLGGSANKPQTIWASKIGDYYNFSAAMLPGDNLLPTDSDWTFNPPAGVEPVPEGGNDYSNGSWRIETTSQVNENYACNVANGSAVGNPWESAEDFSSTGFGSATMIISNTVDFKCECVAICARGDDTRTGYPQDFTIIARDADGNELERIIKTDEQYWTPAEKRLYYFTEELEGVRRIELEFTRIEVLNDTYKVSIGEVKIHPASGIVDEEEAAEDDYLELELAGTAINRIIFLQPFNKKLVVGTSGGIWVSDSETMTRSKVSFTQQTGDAPADGGVLPINANNSMLFIMSGINFAADFVYRLQYDDMAAENISSFNRSTFAGKRVVAWAWQKHPENIIWVVFDDGSLYGLSYQRDQKLFAWHEHSTQGKFRDVSAITTSDGADEVYFVVEREVQEETRYYIEKLSDYSVAPDYAAFADCHLRYDSQIASASFSQCEHLAGMECQVWAEDYFQDVTVSTSGTFSIDFERNNVVVGLGYESRLTTMQKEVQLEDGSTIGRNRDVLSARCILNNAVYAKGGVGDELQELEIQTPTLEGNLEVVSNADPEALGEYLDGRNSTFTIQCDKPVPLEVLSLSIRINFV